MIGNYRIIRKIGAGGMGIVYEAEQQNPRRLVALKVIKGGQFIDDSRIRLFEREAQVLARLKHPGIAAIYESGRTSDGQHFFAMELIRGETLKDYLEKTSTGDPLAPVNFRQRLAIFRKIAGAVTYAHQRGVIHRDLKPANIIVLRDLESCTMESGLQIPGIKILDFGLARITETDLAAATIGTEIGAIQGTLPYMSPEQVRGNPDEIDIRSDVYSLGIILYEMIAGRRPYDLQHAMLHEAVRVICETQPDPLSKSWSGAKKPDRDIETIVKKALEKSAARRYQSVSALSDDVSRFLTGQPILARPPTLAYQLQKLAARHKLKFGFAGSMVVLIALFAVIMSIQAEKIARERDRANLEARLSKQVSDFMKTLFRSPDPFRGKGKEVTAREILDEGSIRVNRELKEQPELQAEILSTMAVSYYGLGSYEKAAEVAQNALDICESRLGHESAATAEVLSLLGMIKLRQGDLSAAENLMQESLAIRRKIFGPYNILVAESINDVAAVHHDKGDIEKATEGYRESLNLFRKILGNESGEVATCAGNLAIVLKNQGKYEEALPLYKEALSIRRKIHGPNHPTVGQALNNLGMLYLLVKNYTEAEALLNQALSINRQALGDEHFEVAANLKNLARVNLECGQLDRAEKYYREAIVLLEKNLGKDHPTLARVIDDFGMLLTKERKFEEAEEKLRKALSIKLLHFDKNHYEVAITNSLLGACYSDQNMFEKAEPLLSESYLIIKGQFGTGHNQTIEAGLYLIDLYEKSGEKNKAAAIKEELKVAG